MLTPYPHQIEGAEHAYQILKENGLVYLAWEERTGKSLTAILIAEKSKAQKILILTKKKALDGWDSTLEMFLHSKSYTVTNYHKACKLRPEFDLIILDESHSYLSSLPKTGKIWKDVAILTKGVPLIYLSATPYAESVGQLYHQLKLSSWCPFKERNYYDFWRKYGSGKQIRTPYGFNPDYKDFSKEGKEEILQKVDHLFLRKTRSDLDFLHEPEDQLHYVELLPSTKKLIDRSRKDEVAVLPDGTTILLDSPMKLRTSIYMIEGGVIKNDDDYLILPNNEKIDYIKKTWGDSDNIAIMYQFIAEGMKLRRHFNNALILQGDSNAEGVDLSHIDHLIIYSMSFSTSRYIQRRARQANKNRKSPIIVHHLLVKDGISEAVYDSVALKKQNFTKDSYERWATRQRF